MDEDAEQRFSVPDYIVFGAMLLASSVIGVYFAYGGKQSNTKEYLMAGRDMSWFPIFVSLLASYLSAITLLGVPSEIYTYGLQYIVLCFSYFILVLWLVSYFYRCSTGCKWLVLMRYAFIGLLICLVFSSFFFCFQFYIWKEDDKK